MLPELAPLGVVFDPLAGITWKTWRPINAEPLLFPAVVTGPEAPL